jgi:hypothetical protein
MVCTVPPIERASCARATDPMSKSLMQVPETTLASQGDRLGFRWSRKLYAGRRAIGFPGRRNPIVERVA